MWRQNSMSIGLPKCQTDLPNFTSHNIENIKISEAQNTKMGTYNMFEFYCGRFLKLFREKKTPPAAAQWSGER